MSRPSTNAFKVTNETKLKLFRTIVKRVIGVYKNGGTQIICNEFKTL